MRLWINFNLLKKLFYKRAFIKYALDSAHKSSTYERFLDSEAKYRICIDFRCFAIGTDDSLLLLVRSRLQWRITRITDQARRR